MAAVGEIERQKKVQNDGESGHKKEKKATKTPKLLLHDVIKTCKDHHIVLTKTDKTAPDKNKGGEKLFFCEVCNFTIKGKFGAFSHMKTKNHTSNLKHHNEFSFINTMPLPTPEHEKEIALALKAVYEDFGMLEDNMQARIDLCKGLEEIAEEESLGCDVRLIGSSLYGAGLKFSSVDIDICIRENKQNTPQYKILTKIFEKARESGKYSDVEPDLNNKRPTIHLTDAKSGMKAKVNVGSSFLWRTANLLKIYCDLDPRVRILGTAFRYWSHICNLDDENGGGLTSYVCILIVIHFLQHTSPPVLPVFCLEQSSKSEETEMEQGGNERIEIVQDLSHVLSKARKWKTKNTDDIGSLWLNLFRFYLVVFKTEEFVINIRSTQNITRKEKGWGKRRFAIEDPFARKYNVGDPLGNNQVYQYITKVMGTTLCYFGNFGKKNKKEKKKLNREVDTSERKNSLNAQEIGKLEAINVGEQDISNVATAQTDITPDPVIAITKTCEVMQIDTTKTTTCDFVGNTNSSTANKGKVGLTPFTFEESKLTGKQKPPIDLFANSRRNWNGNRSNIHTKNVSPLPPLTKEYELLLTWVCEHLYNFNAITKKGEQTRHDFVLDLQKELQSTFPACRLHLFGSSINGFGMKKSDLDVCITLDDSWDPPEGFDHVEEIKRLGRSLTKIKNLDRVLTISTAKVPICKFYARHVALEGDISFYNILAQRNSALLKCYAKISPQVTRLGFLIKIFAKVCNIGDASKGSLSSYAYIIMLLHYLQQCDPPVVPVLQEIHFEDKKPCNIVEGWDCWFFEDKTEDNAILKSCWTPYGKNNQSLGALVVGFFRYFIEDFNFFEDVVSIRQSKRLTKFEKMWTGACIAIEDPFNLGHNLGRGVSKAMFEFIYKVLVRGRERFGKPVPIPDLQYLLNYLFDAMYLTGYMSAPSNRLCRHCGHIGHRANNCEHRRNENEKMKNRANNHTPKGKIKSSETREHNGTDKNEKEIVNRAGNSEYRNGNMDVSCETPDDVISLVKDLNVNSFEGSRRGVEDFGEQASKSCNIVLHGYQPEPEHNQPTQDEFVTPQKVEEQSFTTVVGSTDFKPPAITQKPLFVRCNENTSGPNGRAEQTSSASSTLPISGSLEEEKSIEDSSNINNHPNLLTKTAWNSQSDTVMSPAGSSPNIQWYFLTGMQPVHPPAALPTEPLLKLALGAFPHNPPHNLINRSFTTNSSERGNHSTPVTPIREVSSATDRRSWHMSSSPITALSKSVSPKTGLTSRGGKNTPGAKHYSPTRRSGKEEFNRKEARGMSIDEFFKEEGQTPALSLPPQSEDAPENFFFDLELPEKSVSSSKKRLDFVEPYFFSNELKGPSDLTDKDLQKPYLPTELQMKSNSPAWQAKFTGPLFNVKGLQTTSKDVRTAFPGSRVDNCKIHSETLSSFTPSKGEENGNISKDVIKFNTKKPFSKNTRRDKRGPWFSNKRRFNTPSVPSNEKTDMGMPFRTFSNSEYSDAGYTNERAGGKTTGRRQWRGRGSGGIEAEE